MGQDRVDLLRLEHEFRHVRMTGGEAFQRLAEPITGYFARCPNSGIAMGLVPVRSMAWHLEQWAATSECALEIRTILRQCRRGSRGSAERQRQPPVDIHLRIGHCCCRLAQASRMRSMRACWAAFHDRNVGACSTPRQPQWVARDQNRGRQNRPLPQLAGQVKPPIPGILWSTTKLQQGMSRRPAVRAAGIKADQKASISRKT